MEASLYYLSYPFIRLLLIIQIRRRTHDANRGKPEHLQFCSWTWLIRTLHYGTIPQTIAQWHIY